MRTSLARLIKDEKGSTAIEYSLIAAGIAIAILTALNALGGSLGGLFETVDRTPMAVPAEAPVVKFSH